MEWDQENGDSPFCLGKNPTHTLREDTERCILSLPCLAMMCNVKTAQNELGIIKVIM